MSEGESPLFADVTEVFGGYLPLVFRRMHEAGELEQAWPTIRSVLVSPEPLSPLVVQALFAAFSLRCSSRYCFVLHALSMTKLGADKVEIDELARVLDMPKSEPDHERWSRVIKLAWLAKHGGPQHGAAEELLRRTCSEAEYQRVMDVYAANLVLNSFTVAPELSLDDEPMLESFPAELRSLVPEFVQFHVYANDHDPGSGTRPVSTMCSICRKLRAVDGQWYPFEAAAELLMSNTAFSHGLCSGCLPHVED